MYHLRYKKTALKAIRRLPPPVRLRLLTALEHLAAQPDDPTLDVCPLQGCNGYRLRVGQWRIIYHRDNDDLVILVVDVGSRGDIYK